MGTEGNIDQAIVGQIIRVDDLYYQISKEFPLENKKPYVFRRGPVPAEAASPQCAGRRTGRWPFVMLAAILSDHY
jgi:hypothetical protein